MRLAIIVILFCGVAGSVYWNKKLFDHVGELTAENEMQGRELQRLREKIATQAGRQISQQETESETIKNLKALLEKKLAALTLARQKLDASGVAGEGNAPTTLAWDIKNKTELIQTLQRQLDEAKYQEGDTDSQGKSYQSRQQINHSEAQINLTSQIQAQEAVLKQMDDRANYLNSQRYDLTAQQELRQLKSQIADQKMTLNSLKNQRQIENQQWNAVRAGTDLQVRSKRADYKALEAQLKTRLDSEKESLRGMQKQQEVFSKTQSDAKNLRGVLEADVKAKAADVQETRSALMQHEQKLLSLPPALPQGP